MSDPKVRSGQDIGNEIIDFLRSMGGSSGNKAIREALNIAPEIFFDVRNALIDQGVLASGRGKGGATRLIEFSVSEVEHEEAVSEAVEVKPVRDREVDLYEPAIEAIDKFLETKSYDLKIIENTAMQGRRQTGGTWTRPDVTVVATQAFPYYPGRIFDIITFEIKPADQMNVTGVFEALSHRQSSTLAYVVYQETKQRKFDGSAEMERIMEVADQNGIGVFVAPRINDYDTWEEVVSAKRCMPAPEKANAALAKLSGENRDKILKWTR